MKGDPFYWWDEPWHEWTFFAVHRHHYNVIHSIAWVMRDRDHRRLTPGDILKYFWAHNTIYRHGRYLFSIFWEVPSCHRLRFGHLREDLNAFLTAQNLGELTDNEFRREASIHHTGGKPRGRPPGHDLSPSVLRWIDKRFGWEMEQLGYKESREPPEEPPA